MVGSSTLSASGNPEAFGFAGSDEAIADSQTSRSADPKIWAQAVVRRAHQFTFAAGRVHVQTRGAWGTGERANGHADLTAFRVEPDRLIRIKRITTRIFVDGKH